MRMRLYAAAGVCVWLAGCSTTPRSGAPAPVVGGEGQGAPPAGTEVRPYVPPGLPPVQYPDSRGEGARPMPNRAVQVLVSRSQDQVRDGDLNAAAASLERAIRIAPREAELWYRLAEVRERQGQFGLASDLAAKSNALAGDSNPALSRDNWWLIARARRAVGDLAGARAAERHATAAQLKLR